MGLTRVDRQSNLVPHAEFRARQRDAALGRNAIDDAIQPELTEQEQAELDIARYCRKLLANAVRARAPHDTWDQAWDTYIGDMWPALLPKWKAKITINKVRALIHFMQAVMTDNKPRMSVMPVVPGTEKAAKLADKLHDRHWDDNDCQDKYSLTTLYGLIWGTGIVKAWYDPNGNGGRGKHEDEVIPPYRIYVDKHAQDVEDARYLIHIEPRPLGWIYEKFPAKARQVKKFRGAKISPDGEADAGARDLVREGQRPAQRERIISPVSMSGVDGTLQMPRNKTSDTFYDDDQDEIEVAEFWFRDESMVDITVVKYVDNMPQFEDVTDPETGLPQMEVTGYVSDLSPLDGQPYQKPVYRKKRKPIMETKSVPQFPNGRLVMMAGPVVLRDIPGPYLIDGFPFAKWCDQDCGTFFGIGEALQLRDQNIAINRIVGGMYDNINRAGNTSYLVQKDSGINPRTWRNKPATLLPVENIKEAIQKIEEGTIPSGSLELVQLLKGGMNEVSGINDSITGAQNPTNAAFATIDQLQESSAAPLRLKVRNSEKMLKRWGKIRVQLIQQFDDGSRPIREDITRERMHQLVIQSHGEDEEGNAQVNYVVPPAAEAEVKFQTFKNSELQGLLEFKVAPDSSLSTSPAGMWNRYIQLVEKKLIDPLGFHQKFQLDDWQGIVQRLSAMNAGSAGKPGPASRARGGRHQTPAPNSSMPNHQQLGSVR